MAKMSQTAKEIIQIVVFLVVVGALALVFVIYPLNRTKAFLARTDIDDYNADSLPANDPSAFLELGAVVDTFRIDSDGLTNLACIYLTPSPDSASSDLPPAIRGGAVLVHDIGEDRAAMLPLAKTLLDSGYAVCLYDQRASGLSTGGYHSNGEYEAVDLAEVISYLGLRDLAPTPLIAVGKGLGADAAIMAAADEPRLNGVVAIEPDITSERWLDRLMDEHDMYWIPFSHTLFKFWYELRSGYAPEYVGPESLRGVRCLTLILSTEDLGEDEAFKALAERAGNRRIGSARIDEETRQPIGYVLSFLRQLPVDANATIDNLTL